MEILKFVESIFLALNPLNPFFQPALPGRSISTSILLFGRRELNHPNKSNYEFDKLTI
jgi:hypothetical protein